MCFLLRHTGGVVETKRSALEAFIRAHGNVVSAAQARAAGFSAAMLSYYVRCGDIDRVRHGVYALPGELRDEMCEIQKLLPRAVFSHETALWLNGLGERTPFRYMLTIPSDTNVSALMRRECQWFYVRSDLHAIGVHEVTDTFGNRLRCYNPERTVCDLLRSRNKLEQETVSNALKRYVESGTTDMALLTEYAKRFRVSRILRTYMEVLL